MYMNFQNFALYPFECRVSFELLAFIGAITVVNLLVSICTSLKFNWKIDQVLVCHDARVQNQKLPIQSIEPLPEPPSTVVYTPPAQPNPPGGARMQAILKKLPIRLAIVIANSSESLAEEFASTKDLEDVLNEIYANHPADHADEIFERLAEDMVSDFAPYAQNFVDHLVIRVMLEYNDLWNDHSRQRVQKYSDDARKMQAVQVKAGRLLDKSYAKQGKSLPIQCSTSATTIDPLYRDLFETPNAWVIQP